MRQLDCTFASFAARSASSWARYLRIFSASSASVMASNCSAAFCCFLKSSHDTLGTVIAAMRAACLWYMNNQRTTCEGLYFFVQVMLEFVDFKALMCRRTMLVNGRMHPQYRPPHLEQPLRRLHHGVTFAAPCEQHSCPWIIRCNTRDGCLYSVCNTFNCQWEGRGCDTQKRCCRR